MRAVGRRAGKRELRAWAQHARGERLPDAARLQERGLARNSAAGVPGHPCHVTEEARAPGAGGDRTVLPNPQAGAWGAGARPKDVTLKKSGSGGPGRNGGHPELGKLGRCPPFYYLGS